MLHSCRKTQLLFILAVTANAFAGRRPIELPGLDFKPAVVHGNPVQVISKWPWQVFIELDNGRNQCGGSLISEQWVLTAAHCFDGTMKATKLVLGSIKKQGGTAGSVTAQAELTCCHPDYNTVTLDNDICLVKLNRRIFMREGLRSVPLPQPGSVVAAGAACDITGWGYDENLRLPDILQEASVNIVSRKQCVEWHKNQTITVVNNTICAGHEKGGPDSCGGDSGGPLVCRERSGRYVIRGITSYGPSFCGAAKAPGVYTKVSHFVDWINKNMANPCPIFKWSEWSKGACSQTCGKGVRTDVRYCQDEKNSTTNSSNCSGPSTRQMNCSLPSCPVYRWGSWIESSCSVTCGRGVKHGVRRCLNEKNAAVSDDLCEGLRTRTSPCTLDNCPIYRWGSWIAAPCSVTCGSGEKHEFRMCVNEKNISVSSDLCTGLRTRTSPCTLEDCTIPGFHWGDWSAWSLCQPHFATNPCIGQIISTRDCLFAGTISWVGLCSPFNGHQRTRDCDVPGCDSTGGLFSSFLRWREGGAPQGG